MRSAAPPRRTPAEIALDLALATAGLLAAALLVSVLLRVFIPQWGGFGREHAGGGKAGSRVAQGGIATRTEEGEEGARGAQTDKGNGGTAGDRGRNRGPGAGAPGGARTAAGGGMAAVGEIRVQVLNGCGVAGAGAAMASVLRRAGGIDVVEIGNADDFDFESSVVIDRRGERTSALRVARALGDAPVVLQRSDGCCEVTVIVGYDRGRWLDPLQGDTGP